MSNYYYKSEEEIREENIKRGWLNTLDEIPKWLTLHYSFMQLTDSDTVRVN